ncbi:MAG: GNAT family N-acetyltransferase [Candidatus Limnocylindria bacterium]
MDWKVQDNSAEHQYEIVSEDTERAGVVGGFIAYSRSDGVITVQHTQVEQAYRDEGLGSVLARGALDDARERRLWVIPECPFVRRYIARHREYVDLVPPEVQGEYGLS